MVEKVAKAISQWMNCERLPHPPKWERLQESTRRAYREQAQAAIEAMGEPERGSAEAHGAEGVVAPSPASHFEDKLGMVQPKKVPLERCARAVFDDYYPHGYGEVPDYDAAPESHKKNLRRNAKAVLDAAGVAYE
jgi:hypothetical protein